MTDVDSIGYNLLFERFLSEERPEAPDIDLDFAHRDREKVLQYVYERYGREHAAMVCEQITYRGRSAIRDTARVLGFSAEQAGALANLSDRFSAKATAEALRSGMTAQEMAGRYRDHDARWDEPNGAFSGIAKPKDPLVQPWTAEWLRAATDGKDLPARTNTRPFLSSGKARRFEREEKDPHTRARPVGKEDHEERRNPVTAIRPVPAESILGQVGLDPNDARVRLIPAIVDGLHQLPPRAFALKRWIDRDRPDADDRVALEEKVRADDLAAALDHDAPDARIGNQHLCKAVGHFEIGEVARKVVLVGNRIERGQDDRRDRRCIRRRHFAKSH